MKGVGEDYVCCDGYKGWEGWGRVGPDRCPGIGKGKGFMLCWEVA